MTADVEQRATHESAREPIATLPQAAGSFTIPAPIQRFLDGIRSGNWDGMQDYLTPDVLYDATVPGWHYQYQGAARVLKEFRDDWTGRHPWRIVGLRVTPTPDGAVVEIEARAIPPGSMGPGPHEIGARLANIFRLEDGRIAEHRFYCSGEWDAETLRRVDAEAPRVRRPGL